MMRFISEMPCRLAWRLAIVVACAPLASPALAGCPLGWNKRSCYSVSVQGGGLTPTQNMPNFQLIYGDSPLSAETPMSDISGGASALASDAHNGTILIKTAVYSDGYASLANADLQYTFRLTPTGGGTPSDALVPLHVSALAQSLRDSQEGVTEYASFVIQQDGANLIFKSSNRPFDRIITMFAVDQWINVKPNDDIVVGMAASSRAGTGRGYSRVTSGVYIDPSFELAPEYASRYTLVGLPLDVTAQVPEPASWAMLLAGLGLMGGARLRGRLKA
jgi:hypothetical protein